VGGESELFLSYTDALDEERHVAGELAHCLQAFRVLLRFAGQTAVLPSLFGLPLISSTFISLVY
jgi:hypothetical protein